MLLNDNLFYFPTISAVWMQLGHFLWVQSQVTTMPQTSMTEIIFLVQEAAEGGFEAKALSASIVTEADSLDELREMVRDAVACHFEDEDRPKVIRLHFVREEIIAA